MFTIIAIVSALLNGSPAGDRFTADLMFETAAACEAFKASDENTVNVQDLRDYLASNPAVTEIVIDTKCVPVE